MEPGIISVICLHDPLADISYYRSARVAPVFVRWQLVGRNAMFHYLARFILGKVTNDRRSR